MMPPELHLPAAIAATAAATCWARSLDFNAYRWVDRIWSGGPQIYNGVFAALAGWNDVRLNLMTAPEWCGVRG
jgi:steroid 5-alpha reductase family enzyme